MKKAFPKNRKMQVTMACKSIEENVLFLEYYIDKTKLEKEDLKHLTEIKDFLSLTVKQVKKKAGVI